MSVLQNPIVGRMKQKIGGVVMTTWKGINVMKGKPLTVANPRTDKQLMRRSALSQIVAIGRVITAAIDFGFKEQAVKKSAFNAFESYNLKNAFDYSAPPAATIDESLILVAQGTIAPTDRDGQSASAATKKVTINWLMDSLLAGQSASDIAQCALYNVTKQQWVVPTNPNKLRSQLTADFTCPVGFLTIGDNVRVFLFFYNTSTRKSSDSTNATLGVGA